MPPPLPDPAAITCWIFDCDNTLYPASARLFDQIEARMTAFVARHLGIPADEADRLRRRWWREHGTTLAGLMAGHGVDPIAYLDDVHAIDLSALAPDPALAAAIAALPGRAIVHTNADAAYAGRVLARRGLGVFSAVWGIGETNFIPKPDPRAYAAIIAAERIDPARAVFVEDDPRNLIEPARLGMTTVLVGGGRHGPDPADGGDPGAHVQHRTDDLAGWLTMLLAGQGPARHAKIPPM